MKGVPAECQQVLHYNAEAVIEPMLQFEDSHVQGMVGKCNYADTLT